MTDATDFESDIDDSEWTTTIDPVESHRGAFGEFGGESSGLIDRTFRERILLVGVTIAGADPDETDQLLDELELLVDTAGADVVARVHQRRRAPDPATYIGKGKAHELRELAEATDCDTVVFDDELTPAQQFNLEKLLGRTALDRTAVIIDIFAQNASSIEGKAQVELAQINYRLPRLRGKGTVLSQQGAGIGTRGPGETKLEVDRRRLTRRRHQLVATLANMAKQRSTQSKQRRRSGFRHAVIVGYTNAGKSTLLNRLTEAGVLAEDRLFATLDPTTKRLTFPADLEAVGEDPALITDTVGFVQKLPHHLVEAFKTTLHVVVEADLLVHVFDASAPDPEAQIATVRSVIAEIGGAEVPELMVANKIDLIDDDTVLERLRNRYPDLVAISAATGEGVDALLAVLARRLAPDTIDVTLTIPYSDAAVLARAHAVGRVRSEQHGDDATSVNVSLPVERLGEFRAYRSDVVVLDGVE